MIFSELYSAYYNAIAAIIGEILDGEVDEKRLQTVVAEHAFGESVLTILPSLKSERWQLVRGDMTTPIVNRPSIPLTTLQRRWLKAITLDPRFRLFGIEISGLDDIDPLFTPDDYHVYDKYGDGDPYEDEGYIARFRVILAAMRTGSQIKIEMTTRKGGTIFVRCHPIRLEYSEKDDKFRLITAGWHSVSTVNLARIVSCVQYTGEKLLGHEMVTAEQGMLTLRVVDERNALERVMLHFAHFEKQAERLEDGTYLLKVKYTRDDENELVIRVLSFGPFVEVVGSEDFKKLVVEKLKKQKNCGLK